MDILSITTVLDKGDMPDTFMVGMPPICGGTALPGPEIKSIKFFETSTVYAKIYRGPLYVVKFIGDVTVRRVIPANKVMDITIETKKPDPELPELPNKGVIS